MTTSKDPPQGNRLTPQEIDMQGFQRANELLRSAVHPDKDLMSNNLLVLQATAIHLLSSMSANSIFQQGVDQESRLSAVSLVIKTTTEGYLASMKNGEMTMHKPAPKIQIVKS